MHDLHDASCLLHDVTYIGLIYCRKAVSNSKFAIDLTVLDHDSLEDEVRQLYNQKSI
jgi:hypothetical protein